MKLPPAWLRLQISGPRSAWPGLWLPLFLLWPLLWLLFALGCACVVPLLCVSARISAARALEVCTGAYALLCAARGAHVDVIGPRSQVLVRVY